MRRGFTLIELMVVTGIIATLAAILFPVFSQSKQAAQKAGCASNVRQLSSAMVMYVDDHDGTYPMRIAGTDVLEVDQWIDMIFPYVRVGVSGKTSPLSRCTNFVPSAGLPNGDGRKRIIGWGYGMNGHLHAGPAPMKESVVTDSAAIALIGDSTLGDIYARPHRRTRSAFANSAMTSPYELPCRELRTRHGSGNGLNFRDGGSMMSFTDGHVKFLTAGYIMDRLGIYPTAPNPGDPMFFEGIRTPWCDSGPVLNP